MKTTWNMFFSLLEVSVPILRDVMPSTVLSIAVIHIRSYSCMCMVIFRCPSSSSFHSSFHFKKYLYSLCICKPKVVFAIPFPIKCLFMTTLGCFQAVYHHCGLLRPQGRQGGCWAGGQTREEGHRGWDERRVDCRKGWGRNIGILFCSFFLGGIVLIWFHDRGMVFGQGEWTLQSELVRLSRCPDSNWHSPWFLSGLLRQHFDFCQRKDYQ